MSNISIYEMANAGYFTDVKIRIDKNKALLEIPDAENRLLIHWAALGGNINLVRYLLDLGSPVDPADNTNTTPLILAASTGRVDIVRLLIEKGAEVNTKTDKGQSSLHYACGKGHGEVATILIEAGANINEVDDQEATPLHKAAGQGRHNIIKMLLEYDELNMNAVNSKGFTALHIIVKRTCTIYESML